MPIIQVRSGKILAKLAAVSAVLAVFSLSSVLAQAQSVPNGLTLQPGTVVQVRVSDELSSEWNRPGDQFTAVLEQPLVADGYVVAYRGQPVTGRVVVAQKAGRVKGVSQLGIELSDLTLADGQVVPMRTRLLQTSAGSSKDRDVAAVAATTGLGAAIGAMAGGGKGAGIGAGAGAAAGVIGVLATPGRPTVIPPETPLTFRVEDPVDISTERTPEAFRPVTDQTFDNEDRAQGEPRREYLRSPRYDEAPPYDYPAYPRVYYYPYPAYPRAYAYPVYPYPYGYSYYRPYRYPYYYGSGVSFYFGFGGSHYYHGGYGRGYGHGYGRGYGYGHGHGHGRGHGRGH